MIAKPTFTIEDAVDYIMLRRNKGRIKCFVDWTRAQIALAISNAIRVEGFAFATNHTGNQLAGIVIAKPDPEKKELRICHCLGETGALRALIKMYKLKYEGYRITASRRQREVSFDGNRLARLAETV
jgi:hypothetical protein